MEWLRKLFFWLVGEMLDSFINSLMNLLSNFARKCVVEGGPAPILGSVMATVRHSLGLPVRLTGGPVVQTGLGRGEVRKRNANGRFRGKRSDAGKSRKK